ncbi:MAG: hypothetical protein BWX80_00906 [Candidatus Hydrogenedentes bacterium ADurb.Bin101]|nr:MAG: hypothetical protein BWX80_00906 [Candidatus Hydrogenedentes bacterium ADurb.Bin101]
MVVIPIGVLRVALKPAIQVGHAVFEPVCFSPGLPPFIMPARDIGRKRYNFNVGKAVQEQEYKGPSCKCHIPFSARKPCHGIQPVPAEHHHERQYGHPVTRGHIESGVDGRIGCHTTQKKGCRDIGAILFGPAAPPIQVVFYKHCQAGQKRGNGQGKTGKIPKNRGMLFFIPDDLVFVYFHGPPEI